jgi:2-dehydro-3-deoxyphosphogluconate aldolase/(4S)-4-hydroxy-2-oxoglutarate aldolase
MTLAERGFLVQKLFPVAQLGGPSLLKMLMGPLSEISFCPSGGILPDDVEGYLQLENVLYVAGTWMIPKRDGRTDFAGVAAAMAATAAKSARKGGGAQA